MRILTTNEQLHKASWFEHSSLKRSILVNFHRSNISEEVLLDCLKYIESLLERPCGRSLLEQFFVDGRELTKIILLSANKRLSLAYVNRTLKLAVRILQLGKMIRDR